jgi:hypothetical protein
MGNNKDNSDFGLMFFISGIMIMLGITIGSKIDNTLESDKLITPSITIECLEIDGSKKCDTTYTYINK